MADDKETNEKDINVDVLSRKIQEGMATREERGIALKNVNTQMAVELVASLNTMKEQNVGLMELRGLLAKKLNKRGRQAIEDDSMELDELMDMVSTLTDMELKVADMYRKVLQGNRLLFDEDSMSEEQKIVVRLLNSFETFEQKRNFLNLASNYMNSKGGNLEEAQVVETH